MRPVSEFKTVSTVIVAPDFIRATVIQVGMGETGHIGTPAAYRLFVEGPDGS
jgi:hypothetical protein